MLKEDVEKSFLMEDGDHGDDLSTFDEMMSNINFKKQFIQDGGSRRLIELDENVTKEQ